MKGQIKRSLIIALGGYVLLMLLVLYVFAVGRISMYQLAIDYVILSLSAVVALTVFLELTRRKARRGERADAAALDTKEREVDRKSARNCIIAILVLGALLIFGLFDSNGSPLWVTLLGASINISIICVLSITVRNKMRIVNQGDLSRPK